MAKSIVLIPVSASFKAKIQRLAKEGSYIAETYADLTERMLKFALAFREASKEAEKLDQGEDGEYARFMRETLSDAIDTRDKSIWSRWNTIGTYANSLLKYSEHLPPQRDSLYEVALAAKEKLPVGNWVKSSQITFDTSVRDLRALRNSTGNSKTKNAKKAPSKRGRHRNAQITLSFSSYANAVDATLNLIKTRSDFDITAHHAFAEALKSVMTNDEYDEIKDRIR